MKVRVNANYIYYPCLLDMIDGRTDLVPGTVVKVINLFGCPKANTMGHCYVGDVEDGHFIGMVCTGSLHAMADRQLVIDALKADVARLESKAVAS